VVQTIRTLVDEIRHLTEKLEDFKQLYFIQMHERELAGKQYVALQDELDENKHVVLSYCLPIAI